MLAREGLALTEEVRSGFRATKKAPVRADPVISNTMGTLEEKL